MWTLLKYILLAIMSFVMSAYAFAGMITVKGSNEPSTIYFGNLFLGCGLFFAYRFLKEKSSLDK